MIIVQKNLINRMLNSLMLSKALEYFIFKEIYLLRLNFSSYILIRVGITNRTRFRHVKNRFNRILE